MKKFRSAFLGAVLCLVILASHPGQAALPEAVRHAGKGTLYRLQGHRVAVLAGSPEEMGRQHGRLLKDEVLSLIRRINKYGEQKVGGPNGLGLHAVLELIWQRTHRFVPDRYVQEMDALARATGLSPREVYHANVLPELFHCSGFALKGKSTTDGRLLHGRILDYATDAGLQDYAVTFICLPEGKNAFVNVGYAGFIGSVTGMNSRQVAFGEMGGGGVGQWDGMPMSFLMRTGMEEADTLAEALELFRSTPRTCEYFYVISDGKTGKARGLRCTPEDFETVNYGESHPLLPSPVPDTILLSANERYSKLVERVNAAYGDIDAARARQIMKRPVSMDSNLHCVLFDPASRTLWIAHAADPDTDPDFQACNQPYLRLDFGQWLERAGSGPGSD